jgi:DNA-binding PadR family transcriptional regulator
MLDLAILGLLQDQPLHGYELKKRLSDTLGPFWGVSFGSLYPALRRLERSGAVVEVGTGAPAVRASIPATGSLKGEAAAARVRGTVAKPSRRKRKAYRITDAGREQFRRLLLEDEGDDERAFSVRLAFGRHLEPEARIALLERRRAELADRLSRARRTGGTGLDRYASSLVEHRTRSTERDLEWIDDLIRGERAQSAPHPGQPRTQGASA